MDTLIQVEFEVSNDKLPRILALLAGKVENIVTCDVDEVVAAGSAPAAGPGHEPAACKPADQPE